MLRLGRDSRPKRSQTQGNLADFALNALGAVRPSGFRLPQALHPVNLSEFEGFSEAERKHPFSPLDPFVRVLTGAKQVHLASGWAGGLERL